MTLKNKISDDIKNAMKGGPDESMRLSTLRMVASAVANKEIELRKRDIGLSDQEVLDIIATEVKKRKDATEEFRKGGRIDLSKKEEAEAEILKVYLPPEISDEDLLRIVKNGIREAGAESSADFGKVMKVVMPTLRGKASGDRISAVLKIELEKDG